MYRFYEEDVANSGAESKGTSGNENSASESLISKALKILKTVVTLGGRIKLGGESLEEVVYDKLILKIIEDFDSYIAHEIQGNPNFKYSEQESVYEVLIKYFESLPDKYKMSDEAHKFLEDQGAANNKLVFTFSTKRYKEDIKKIKQLIDEKISKVPDFDKQDEKKKAQIVVSYIVVSLTSNKETMKENVKSFYENNVKETIFQTLKILGRDEEAKKYAESIGKGGNIFKKIWEFIKSVISKAKEKSKSKWFIAIIVIIIVGAILMFIPKFRGLVMKLVDLIKSGFSKLIGVIKRIFGKKEVLEAYLTDPVARRLIESHIDRIVKLTNLYYSV